MELDSLKRRLMGTGVAVASMQELRNWEGAGRLGMHVVRRIEHELEHAGIGHLPLTLPNDQAEFVVLYTNDSPAGRVLARCGPLA